jgi:dipeptidyl aminopeptidase/acylaminoacyl peptidase
LFLSGQLCQNRPPERWNVRVDFGGKMKFRARVGRERVIRIFALITVVGACGILAALVLPIARAQQGYQKPPANILKIMEAPLTPNASVSPAMDYVLLYRQVPYPSIADMAQPMLRLAGLRINPMTSGQHNPPHFTDFVIKKVSDGSEKKVALTGAGHYGAPSWSPDGKHFVVPETTENATHLWVGDTTGAAHVIGGLNLNSILGGGGFGGPGGGGGAPGGGACAWMGNSHTLLCREALSNSARGPVPPEPKVPTGPHIEESSGRATAVATFEDLLQSNHDVALFDYYARSQMVIVDLVEHSGTKAGMTASLSLDKVTPVGKPALFATASPAPDGQHILVARLHHPYSFLLPQNDFPRNVEVWDRSGKVVYTVADIPLADNVPIGGVPTTPRNVTWRSTAPATLIWVEAQDGGITRRKFDGNRDRIVTISAPFTGKPATFAETKDRFAGIEWSEKDDFAILRDTSRATHRNHVYMLDLKNPGAAPRLLWDLDSDARYNQPGNPATHALANGHIAIRQDGDSIFLEGPGASPDGDRPFLDRYNVRTGETKRIFQCPEKAYGTVSGFLKADGSVLLTRHETPTDPPNYYIRTEGSDEPKVFTNFPDPTPEIRGIKKELVKYKRPDGVDLSMEVYLPPDYKEGTRYPAVFWAYPREVANAAVAGEVTGSPYRFTVIRGYSELFFLLDGYVVMDDVSAMPVVGDPETVNNTYVEQIVADAKAAIDKGADMGVVDPNRVGVGGHSYGAFMTANLLAHSTLFRAGIAESGAYNRTLTPFGFQNEERSLWQAQSVYLGMSPFLFADKIKEPILLIHGEADNNSGTFPIQSERMYRAIKGMGGTVRYVTLPLEAHGYAARETIEHVVWEKLNWFDKYVKNASATNTTASSAGGNQ